MGLELSTLGFFALLARQATGSEALLKLFVVQRVGALLFLWVLLSVCATGYSPGVFLLVGASLKLGIIPFAYWVPRVAVYLTWTSLMVLFTILKLPTLLVLTGRQWLHPLLLLGLATSLYGVLLGLSSAGSVAFITSRRLAHMG